MISNFTKILVILCLCYYTDADNFFRKDYTYLKESKSFYKIHTIHRSWWDAKKRCEMEGAKLFYPEDKTEVDAVIAHWNSTQEFHWVFVGISDLLSKGDFETIDGIPVTDVYNVWGVGEPNDRDGIEDCVILRKDGTLNDDRCPYKYPFICKKTAATLEWNVLCDMPYSDYLYNVEMGKCYKFHVKPQNWTDAKSVCNAELSYLAVINSQKEADFLVKLTADAPKDKASGDFLRGAVHLGFHNRNGDGWTTVKGTSLEDSGYSSWGGGQPDNSGKQEVCGSMFYSGRLNDINCQHICFFICEHDISFLGSSVDERYGD